MSKRFEITTYFARAAVAKAMQDWEVVDEIFLATVATGVPDGVRVVYLFADRVEPPDSIDEASHYDVLALEFEGQEGQAMPVPKLVGIDSQLAVSLFAAAEFRPREYEDDWDDEAGDLGDNDPPPYLFKGEVDGR